MDRVYVVTDVGPYLVVILEEAADGDEMGKVLSGRDLTDPRNGSFPPRHRKELIMDARRVRDLLNMDHSDVIAECERAAVAELGAENLEVNKTLRLSMVMAQAIEAEAERRGVKPSMLMRRWIEDGLRSSADQPANLLVPLEDLLRMVRQLARPAAA